ncbi:MAG TPA: glycoside hydrolase family 11 protein [Polyangiaceae bacterium]|nr:glycoside hydrolase family 11 protein [Polyangiaceae bacterium]
MRTIPLHFCALTVAFALSGCSSSSAPPVLDGENGLAGSTMNGGAANASAGGAASAGAASGGSSAAGGASLGGATATGAGGGTAGSATGGTAGSGTGGTTGSGGAATGGAAGGLDCSAMMPTGGTPHTGAMANGSADGLGYGIWSNGSGGTITVFNTAHAFSASWNNGGDFLAHLGLDFNGAKSYTAYGTITADIVETKTGSGGGYSSLGMYGWTQKPCVEWYIVDDSFNKMPTQKSSVTTTIDGGTYYLITNSTSGTGGNACEAGHAGPWTQMWSVRSTARQCGAITVSDHFAAWTKQGWTLGNLTSVHINVEVGGGMGSIEFPVANVTTSSN